MAMTTFLRWAHLCQWIAADNRATGAIFLKGAPCLRGSRFSFSAAGQCIGVVVVSWLITPYALAQVGQALTDRTLPPPEYFLAKQLMPEGEFRRAAQAFQSAGRSAFRAGTNRWLDSICYHAMLGECHYQMGDLGAALEQFNSAAVLYLAFPNWLTTVQFLPGGKPPSYTGPPITWGQPTRTSVPGAFPDKCPVTHPNLANVQVTPDGNLLSQPQFVTMHIAEVARCLALVLRRRAEILGPVGAHDPLNNRLIAALTSRPAPPGHWSQAWVDCWLGLAYVSANRALDAAPVLRNAVTAGGFDHELTPIVLLELGKLAVANGQYEEAASLFYEATFPAVLYGHYDVLEEAFRWGAWTHLLAGRPGAYPPLAGALPWAQRQKLRHLEVSLLIESAEHVLPADAKAAVAFLDRAQRGMVRSPLAIAAVGARYRFVLAHTQYRLGNVTAGDQALAAALAYYQKSGRLVFQVVLAERVVGNLTELAAHELYSTVLREPTPSDWTLWPAETLALLSLADARPWEHWFELSVQRGDLNTACEITDRIRRRQFLAALPFGGRVLALRWLLEAPREALSDTALLQRQDILARWPELQQLSEASRQVRDQLRALPLAPEDMDTQRKQQELFDGWATLSAQQEARLLALATSRQPTELVYPPLRDMATLKNLLPPGHAIWMFFATSKELYAFVINKDGPITGWRIPSASRLRGAVAELLKQIGNIDGNSRLSARDIHDQWKPLARELFLTLADQKPESADVPWKDACEVVIVPHGVLWYLPFELLQVGQGEQLQPMLARVRVRYAPLLGTAVPDNRKPNPLAVTYAVCNKLHPQEPDTVTGETLAQLRAAVPNVVSGVAASVPPALLAALLERAVVFSEVDISKSGPMGWDPLPLASARKETPLATWFSLPWGAPQQLVLPGLRTPAENALKRGGDGSELFLAACALAACGNRTVLLSRWRVGGASARKLVTEFVQELPHRSAPEAWQRSVQLWQAGQVELDREPRLNRATFAEPISGNVPFFWAGYLLIDPGIGSPPQPAETAPAAKTE